MFAECTYLDSIVLPSSITEIGPGCFYNCNNLAYAVLPAGLTYIPSQMFVLCRALNEIIIPDSVTEIKNGAFEACSNLKSITIPTNVGVLKKNAFAGCINIEDVYYGGTEADWKKIVVELNEYFRDYDTDVCLNRAAIHFMNNAVKNPFSDVPEGQYYTDPVLWALKNSITAGVDATHFAPDNSCTRAQVVTFLWRAKGKPTAKNSKNPFVDVNASAYYYDAVLWAYENGVVSGIDATHFGPESTVTRAQFVTFLYRAENKPSYTVKNPFVDVFVGQYYTDPILWAYENGVTAGVDSTHFGTDNPCTRGQVVTFLYRAFNK